MAGRVQKPWAHLFAGFIAFVAIAWIGSIYFIISIFIAPDIRYQAETKARQISFDPNTWRSIHWTTASRGENRIRDYMIDDLLSRYNFKGWYRIKVVDLLGAPDDEAPNFHSDGLTYNWYRIDGAFDYLLFKYDSQNQVVDYLVWHD